MKEEIKMVKKGYFPYWMREPIPEEYRLKWIPRQEVLERLRAGEKIVVSIDDWMKRADWIYFEKDNYQKQRIKKIILLSLEKREIIEVDQVAIRRYSAYSRNLIYKYKAPQ